MTPKSHKQQFTASSFFTSFKNNQTKPNFGLPIGFPFLKSPTWQVVTTKTLSATTATIKTITAAKNKKDDIIQQAMYILPKSPSHTSIFLQLPKFRSLSVFLRCGHVSELVENWLCNPMDHIKRRSKPYYQLSSSLQMSLPVTEMSLVPYRSSLLSIHFQLEHQIQTMEIIYDHLPCFFTIVCVTYNCGSVSLSIRQIESLDFLLSATTMDPFLVQCDLLPNHPVDIHRLREPSSFSLSSNYAEHTLSLAEEFAVPPLLICDVVVKGEKCPLVVELTLEEDAIVLYKEDVDINTSVMIHNPDQLYSLDEEEEIRKRYLSNNSEYIHLKEKILYQQEEEDDDESCLYSSSEEYSVLGDHDTDQEEPQEEEDAAQVALLNLVRDTLKYIQSNGRAYSDELNRLQYKLHNYSRAAETPIEYDYI